MRFWDAQFVGGFLGPIFAPLYADVENAFHDWNQARPRPGRAYRGTFNGADVIPPRYMRSLVVAPYSVMAEGMILPLFDKIQVYACQP